MPTRFVAKATEGLKKYGSNSEINFAKRSGLTDQEQAQLEEVSSFGLTKNTWSNYKTAETLLIKCFTEKRIVLELPISEDNIIKFILWLDNTKGVCAATINNYLAGIRHLHIRKGAKLPVLRTDLVNLMLKGQKNREIRQKYNLEIIERKPITPDILRLLKVRLTEINLSGTDQRLIWSVFTNLFFGAFRASELLCNSTIKFDPVFTLLAKDVKLLGKKEGERMIQFNIKAPKEEKNGKSIIVDVYEAPCDICPVKAYISWINFAEENILDQPNFRWKNGKSLTVRQLNDIIRKCLSGFIEGGEKWYTSHSFRIGAASMMGTLGVEDSEIRALGRWSSRVYETYLRLPRTKRIAVAKSFIGNVS